MRKFFIAAAIIFAFSLVIGLYYFLRQFYRNRKKDNLKAVLKKKTDIDGKEYLRNYLNFHLPKLLDHRLQWIIVSAKFNPDKKIELTFDSIKSEILLTIYEISINQQIESDLKKMGINLCRNSSDICKINTLPNAKILADVIYYLFENVLLEKKFVSYILSNSYTKRMMSIL